MYNSNLVAIERKIKKSKHEKESLKRKIRNVETSLSFNKDDVKLLAELNRLKRHYDNTNRELKTLQDKYTNLSKATKAEVEEDADI